MNDKELENMRKIIKITLIRIGVRCDFVGYSYLCYAIELVILNPELIAKVFMFWLEKNLDLKVKTM